MRSYLEGSSSCVLVFLSLSYIFFGSVRNPTLSLHSLSFLLVWLAKGCGNHQAQLLPPPQKGKRKKKAEHNRTVAYRAFAQPNTVGVTLKDTPPPSSLLAEYQQGHLHIAIFTDCTCFDHMKRKHLELRIIV